MPPLPVKGGHVPMRLMLFRRRVATARRGGCLPGRLWRHRCLAASAKLLVVLLLLLALLLRRRAVTASRWACLPWRL